MGGLKVLITNITLATRTGTETYVRDLALGLLARGHRPVVYSTDLGALAHELRTASVPVVEDLASLAEPPDVIHGHHQLETLTALLHFPTRPALFVCHDRLAWHDAPPRSRRVLRFVAVDETCRDRLVCECGVPPERVSIIPNAVDLARFRPRDPLPARPARALIFSNNATEQTHLPAVREACQRRGLALDVIGGGQASASPERLLGEYDLVFAKARCALEALAVGCAVILCDVRGMGPMVTAAELARLRGVNFGLRALRQPADAAALVTEIDRYDRDDAAAVSREVRTVAGLDRTLDALLARYREVIAEAKALPIDREAELRDVAALCQRLRVFQDIRRLVAALEETKQAHSHLAAQLARQNEATLRWQEEAGRLSSCTGMRLQRWVMRVPLLGRGLRWARGLVRRRSVSP